VETFELVAIGVVESSRTEPVDDGWDAEASAIRILPPLGEDALRGLEAFSHVEVVYVFDRVDPGSVQTGARSPRDNPAWPAVGILAQRGKDRPNRIGVTVCALLGIDGTRLRVRGLDAIDGTPVLDVKPWMREFGPRGDVRQPPWTSELMARYW
jgi:tRNA-Thr(GGU) m(6)t(6)A37 methyltransferase TsaA